MPRIFCSMRARSVSPTRSVLLRITTSAKPTWIGRLLELLQVLLEMPRIHQRDDGIDHELFLQVVVEEEGLRHRTRVGHAGGLDQDVVEAVAALGELAQHADQVAAHRAADAAIAGFEDLLFGADDQLVVDADLAEFVLDHGDALAVVLGKDAVQQRGLAGTQEAGQHGDGNARGFVHVHLLPAVSISQTVTGQPRRSQKPAPRCLKFLASSRRYQAPPRRLTAGSVRDWSQFSSQSSRVSTPKYSRPRHTRARFCQRALGFGGVQVLQHVVADHQVVDCALRREILDAAVDPAIAPGTGIR